MQTLQCMDVWGGAEAVDTGVSVPGLDAWVYSRPYEGAVKGGDLHYLSLCSQGRVARVLLADVSGHGAGVSGIAGGLYDAMRENINVLDQSEMARRLNDTFSAAAGAGRFATAVILSHYEGEVVSVNAGHPAPLWRHAEDGRWSRLEPTCPEAREAATGLPLGVIGGTDYEQFAVRVGAGDAVLIYSDALIEAREGGTGPLLGVAGLMRLAEGLRATGGATERATDAVTLGRRLIEAVDGYRGGEPADDDQTLLTLHFHGRGGRLGTDGG